MFLSMYFKLLCIIRALLQRQYMIKCTRKVLLNEKKQSHMLNYNILKVFLFSFIASIVTLLHTPIANDINVVLII